MKPVEISNAWVFADWLEEEQVYLVVSRADSQDARNGVLSEARESMGKQVDILPTVLHT